jgi:hypothetical protein
MATHVATAAVDATHPHRVLLGVMSNPTSDRLRVQLREWNSLFAAHRQGNVAVRFVFGSSFYNATEQPPAEAVSSAQQENSTHGDLLFVDGRERLPHVGVVTEKSAAFWREIAAKEPGFAFYCKSDDDTMVHLDRLDRVLGQVVRTEGADRLVYLGHMKWRGWDEGYRFQACGGSGAMLQRQRATSYLVGRSTFTIRRARSTRHARTPSAHIRT